MKPAKIVFDIFHEINKIPRASHHEEKMADWLCQFATQHRLVYSRDEHNCVVIRKPATPGYEDREPIVILNHMDMVCVAENNVDFNPLQSAIDAYEEDGWIKARGTSLGADNGIGLSMALAVLQDNDLAHPAIEVLTTTNEEDGMSGAANLSPDFIKGRKVLNLDSEDYDTITVGAAGAYLQCTKLPFTKEQIATGHVFVNITIDGGLGGHSGVDINKGRCNANKFLCDLLYKLSRNVPIKIGQINGGEANASIAMSASASIALPQEHESEAIHILNTVAKQQTGKYHITDPGLKVVVGKENHTPVEVIPQAASQSFIESIHAIPSGVVDPIPEQLNVTPMTSNNIGVIHTTQDHFFISTHTRSFKEKDMVELGKNIRSTFLKFFPHAHCELVMSAPAWKENQDSAYIKSISDTFKRVLGFKPTPVNMHFVLEAGYYVQKYPGIEIACIGPRIVCPHSTKEKVEISTVENIWYVVQEILAT